MLSQNAQRPPAATDLRQLRTRVEKQFAPDTAAAGFGGSTPSSGHCAAVSVITHELFGGEFVSAIVDGRSHWFNRLTVDSRLVDADLTADQFGYTSIRVAPPGELYEGTRVRSALEVNEETLLRAITLAERAEVFRVPATLRKELHRRQAQSR